MKLTLHLLVITLGLSTLANGDSPKLPRDIQVLQEKRNAEVARIDDLYIKALEQRKLKYTKAGDLENALLVDSLIKQVRNCGEKSKTESDSETKQSLAIRSMVISTPWMIDGVKDAESPYKVTFREDGFVWREDKKEQWWKWRIEGDTLWCHWLSSGWVQFDIAADPKVQTWKGKNKVGDVYTMTISPAK